MSMRKTQDRGLHYRRTSYKPGLGVCRCATCQAAHEAANLAARAGEPHGKMGDPVPGCEYVNPELAFAEAWEKKCRPQPGVNYGYGLVQDLMVVHRPGERQGLFGFNGGRMAFWLTPRERVICASVVQWLGTNCGMAFLGEVLRRCGLLIVQDETTTDRYKLLKDDLLAAERRVKDAHRDADDFRAAHAAVLKKLDGLVAAVARVSDCPIVACTHDVVAQVERLVRERDEARAILARLNLDPAVSGSTTVPARFVGIDDDEI